MRVRVDGDLCQGHGTCAMVCPAVFGADDQGFAVVKQIDVPQDLADKVRSAETRCPERAILIDG